VDTYNFAMVRRGGANGEQFMHFKHYISSIDFLDATPGWEGTVTYPIMNVSLPPSSQPQPMGHTTKRYPILDGRARTDLEALAGRSVEGRFEIANVSFCLDICLDHAMGVCADALDAEKKAGTGPGLVSIHAIVSAGMKIEPKHVRVPPGGSAILKDRNDVAVRKLKEVAAAKQGKRLCVFYGAAHMDDFDQKLCRDYQLQPRETIWCEAWDLREPAERN
jgi:hypothetical protein